MRNVISQEYAKNGIHEKAFVHKFAMTHVQHGSQYSRQTPSTWVHARLTSKEREGLSDKRYPIGRTEDLVGNMKRHCPTDREWHRARKLEVSDRFAQRR